MVKNKANKKKNVFKVAGAKSLKAKMKAKTFTGNLKKIKESLRNNINKIDRQLIHLQKDMMKKKAEPIQVDKKQCKVEEEKIQIAKLVADKETTLEKLSEMKF
ncbi:hypothetical protein RUM44_003176 [Polyplax serrata]|uniref:Uncharacterized protein n=1 Tax=Polyplax serrata TaxID=468196 RepID=A0ABR1AXS0_POLSC